MFSLLNNFIAMVPQGGGGASGGGGGMVSMLVMFGGVILVMYFLMIRPQQKRQKEHLRLLESIKKGDKVITSAGIHGSVTNTFEKTLEIQIAENVKITVEKSSVAVKE
jgi:preprotein translocase subunit YajC